MAKFYFSKNYEKSLSVIEDFIFDSTQSIDLIETFLNEHDDTLSGWKSGIKNGGDAEILIQFKNINNLPMISIGWRVTRLIISHHF
jgi:hypothetical protein